MMYLLTINIEPSGGRIHPPGKRAGFT